MTVNHFYSYNSYHSIAADCGYGSSRALPVVVRQRITMSGNSSTPKRKKLTLMAHAASSPPLGSSPRRSVHESSSSSQKAASKRWMRVRYAGWGEDEDEVLEINSNVKKFCRRVLPENSKPWGMFHKWTNRGAGSWTLRNARNNRSVSKNDEEVMRKWTTAILTGKQRKLMVMPQSEPGFWYRCYVISMGPTPGSVRLNKKQKRKRKNTAESCPLHQPAKQRVKRAMSLRPTLSVSWGAILSDPATSAFLNALSTENCALSKWEGVKDLLTNRKNVLRKQLAIVNSQLEQVNLEMEKKRSGVNTH